MRATLLLPSQWQNGRLTFRGRNSMPRVCGFDVNETLSDLRALAPHLGRIFSCGTIHRRRLSWLSRRS